MPLKRTEWDDTEKFIILRADRQISIFQILKAKLLPKSIKTNPNLLRRNCRCFYSIMLYENGELTQKPWHPNINDFNADDWVITNFLNL